MKNVKLVMLLFFLLVSFAFAEDLEFTEYGMLTPEVDTFDQIDLEIKEKHPVILCYRWANEDFVIEYDTKTKQTNSVIYHEQNLHGIFDIYFDRFHMKNYVQAFPTKYYSEDFKYMQFYEINRVIENETPIYSFTLTGPRENTKRRYVSDHTYFEADYYMTVHADKSTSLLINDITKEIINFSPEVIMGFGDGFIMTTSRSEEGLMGFSVWTEDGTLVYKDSDFNLSDPISSQFKYQHVINDSYFCYPYAFINLANYSGIRSPACLVVIDVSSDTVYISPNRYQLMAIFE